MELFIVDMLETFGYIYFISKYISTNQRFKKIYAMSLYFILLLVLEMSYIIPDSDSIILLIMNCLTFFYCYRFSNNSNIEIIFLLLLTETLIIISNIFSLLIVKFLFNYSIEFIFSTPTILINVSLLSKILFCIIGILLLRIDRQRVYVYSKSILILVIINIIIFSSLSYIFSNLVTYRLNESSVVFILISLSTVFILNYVLFNTLKKENHDQLLKSLKNKELEDMRFLIEATKSINDDNIRLRHYLTNINMILKNNNSYNDFNEFKFEICNQENDINFIESSNSIINTIFNTTMHLYAKQKIIWKIYLESDLSCIEDIDLAIILDTLLKLAAENLSSKKEIIFRAKERENFYLLSLVFHYESDFGAEQQLYNLTKIVNKYFGTINLKKQKNTFICDLIIKKLSRNS